MPMTVCNGPKNDLLTAISIFKAHFRPFLLIFRLFTAVVLDFLGASDLIKIISIDFVTFKPLKIDKNRLKTVGMMFNCLKNQ